MPETVRECEEVLTEPPGLARAAKPQPWAAQQRRGGEISACSFQTLQEEVFPGTAGC
jgi:hypothetical protein